MSKRPSEHPPLDPGTLCMGLAAMLGEILSDLTVKVVRRKKVGSAAYAPREGTWIRGVLIGDELTFLLRHRLRERRGRGQELREPAGELAVEGEGLTSEFREAQGDRARGDVQLPRSTADTRRVHREAKQTVKAHAAFGVVVDD